MERPGVIYRKDESAEFIKLFLASLLGILASWVGYSEDLLASRTWPWLLACLTLIAAYKTLRRIRDLPELVEVRDTEILVQATRGRHYRFPAADIRALEVAGAEIRFQFEGEKTLALKLVLPKKAAKSLVSKMVGQFDFVLWSDRDDRAVYRPKRELPAIDGDTVVYDLTCLTCGQRRPSRHWFQDEWGRLVPDCAECREVKRSA